MEEHKKRPNLLKAFTGRLSSSSQKILAAFIDDSVKEKEKQLSLQQQLELAISQKMMTVLQLKPIESSQKFETVSGRLFRNKQNDQMIMVRLEKDGSFKMVDIRRILKISLLPTSK